MVTRTYQVTSRSGLHARPASELVNAAGKINSDISLYRGDKMACAKSIISVMTLGAPYGSEIRVEISGPDEAEGAKIMDHFFQEQLQDL